MTEKEAIKQLKFDQEMILLNPATGEKMTIEEVKALNGHNYQTYIADEVAIIALKEIEKYREIGTEEDCRAAMNFMSLLRTLGKQWLNSLYGKHSV